jgi:hypothetical protein
VEMEKNNRVKFIKKVESLVNPHDVQTISFFSEFNKLLPKKIQDKFMESGNKNIPYMGFIVDPYSFFLAFRIRDEKSASLMLPEGYELAKASFFKTGEKFPMVIASVFTARTSAFAGMRVEFYIIARHKESGMLSWIISEYDTNTNSHDPAQGFGGNTCETAVYTTTEQQELIVDIKSKIRKKTGDNREFILTASLRNGEVREVDHSLWIEGNLSVGYGGELKSDTKQFPLIFDPEMLREGTYIPIEDVKITSNSYLHGIIDPLNPVTAAVFPFAQHFVINQHIEENQIKTESDLEFHIKTFLERTGFKTMKGDDIKKPILRSMFISNLISTGLIIFLLVKLLM